MNFEEVLETVERVLLSRQLSPIERFILHQSWLGKAYTQMAEDSSYCSAYIKTIGSQLWQDLSQALGEKVTKKNLHLMWSNYQKKEQNFRGKNNIAFFPLPLIETNLNSFKQELEKHWNWAACYQISFSLILCEIDFFSEYQEIYGQALANDCLKQVTAAIKSCVNRPTDLVALDAYKQFALILPNTNKTGALHIGERIRTTVKQLVIPNSVSLIQPSVVTISIGIASTIPHLEVSSINLINAAEQALYLSQNQGCDRVTSQPISSI